MKLKKHQNLRTSQELAEAGNFFSSLSLNCKVMPNARETYHLMTTPNVDKQRQLVTLIHLHSTMGWLYMWMKK